jgi:thiosulfate/3-mercaptopyruvate sulfurtransferase
MPGDIDVPYNTLADQRSTVKLKTTAKLLDIFRDVGVNSADSSTQVICTCGSGVSACCMYLAVIECGRQVEGHATPPITRMCDGSWQEWKLYPDAPKVKPA